MARRNQSQFSRILKQLIGKETRKPRRRDVPAAKLSLRAEQLEARRVFAGLIFDSVIVAGNDTVGVYSQATAVDASGNQFMAGTFGTGAVDFDPLNSHPGDADILVSRGRQDAYIAKYDANGEFMWARRMGSDVDGYSEGVNELKLDANGDLYVAGTFNGSGDFGAFNLVSAGAADTFIAKLDAAGEILWARNYGNAASDVPVDLDVDSNGNMNLIAYQVLSGAPSSLTHLDANGYVEWTLHGDGLSTLSVTSDTTGNVIVSGSFTGTVDFDLGPDTHDATSVSAVKDGYVLKLTEQGEFVWLSTFAASSSVDPNAFARTGLVTLDLDGTIALAGTYQGQPDIDPGLGVQQLPLSASTTAFLAKLSANGELLTSNAFTNAVFSTIVNLLPLGGGYLATAGTKVENDVVVMLLDENFNVNSVSNWTGDGYQLVTSLASDDSGNVYLSGWSGLNTLEDYDFNTGTTFNVSNPGWSDAFIIKMHPIAPGEEVVLLDDSFETGEWNGLWVEDIQNDWFRSSQRSTSGSFAAEVDGSATNATLTTANIIDLSGMASATLSFDWLIESGFDSGEYLSLDISTDGGSSWTQDLRRLNGNVSAENVWHSETVDMTPYKSADLKVRFRSKVSASDEDANVDNVRIVGIADGPNTAPTAVVGGPYSVNEGSSVALSGAGSSDPDGSIASYAWDFDNDGQYDDASGVSVSFSTTVSGLHTVGLQVTDNRGATAVTSTTVSVNNIAPTANAGSDVDGFVGTPVSLSASGSSDPGNDLVSYAWDLDNDGQYDDASGVNATFTAAANGTYIVSVLVTDADGATSTDSATITLSTISATSTKFYVVDDGGPDRTYEYGATGNAIENYTINSGNTQPRGAASNSAGDKVWVADRNRKVYVYDTGGGLLGSWSAGTLASTASVEGIATNGTDVWIVDSRSDKVFRYANAAGRTSGSQPAVSSFALNSSNRSSKGIVTDGSYLWIIDSSTTDKIFKYTVTGSLVGSWTIDSANNSPTGLTIDPTGASQSIWIVDSGTDKVYEYTNALGKSSGSQSAANTFALIAGNTNPQGIADPPPADSAVSSTRWTAAQPVSPMPPAVVANQTNSTASRIADDDQRKSLTRSDTTTARLSLQPAANQSQDQSPLSDEFVHVKLPEARHAEARHEEARHEEARIDHFFLEDSFELVDDALLSLLAPK
jgi:hypothetical protein